MPPPRGIARQDTLARFPRAEVIVTNLPWLARNTATRRLPYPHTPHNDLYKHCLHLCLQNAAYVAAIVPASIVTANLFLQRLTAVDIAAAPMFDDTDKPACLALFAPQGSDDVSVYHGGAAIGGLHALRRHLPRRAARPPLRFNDPNGALGLIAFDNTRTASIRFCAGQDLRYRPILRVSTATTGRSFSNKNLAALPDKMGIAGTVSRPGRSNDNSRAEQKNGAVIGQYQGDNFIAGADAVSINHVYRHLKQLMNWFTPSVKLRRKWTDEATGKRKCRHDAPLMPMDRLVGVYPEQGLPIPARIQAELDGRARTNQFEVV